MSKVRITRNEDRRIVRDRRTRIARIASLGLIASALAGIAVVSPQPGTPSAAADSTLTVSWTDDDSAAQQYQPERDPASPHYREFDDIEITVSQTTGIIDQAIRVSVSGFAGTRSSAQYQNAQNFLQAMQCWGPDPLAEDFYETCQWGGRYAQNNGVGDSVYFDNVLRVAARDVNANPPTTHDVPFRTVGGTEISGKPVDVDGTSTYRILDYFSPSTTNEVISARVNTDGTGFFDFETQTAIQAPQLGCGTADYLRCWLVVVPRGTVFGGEGTACSSIRAQENGFQLYTKGQVDSIQAGSPINTDCDYWENRIVVPLDFTRVGNTCPVGGQEFRVIGSQLMVGAMSSWQPSLCQNVGSTFSFSTNPDAIARAQVIEPGGSTPSIAYTGFPVSSGELLTEIDRENLAAAKLSYAPVGVSGIVVAFIAELSNGRQENLVLSPRIMAKLLTQSYRFTVPTNSSDPDKNVAHLGEVNRSYRFLNQDPEFQALNPDTFNEFSANPAIVLPGPSGADAIRQLWRWILADTDAVSFLNGEPDESGMTINPYYLPKGDPAAVVPWYLDENLNYIETPVQREVGLTKLDGSPQRLSEAVLDTFPKNDESLVPLQLTNERSRFDSIQFAPYTDSLLTGARRTFRADPNSRTIWDPNRITSGPEPGDWVSSGSQQPGQKFMISITDTPSAVRFGLDTASLVLPNTDTPVAPTNENFASALSALQATSSDTVRQVSPGAVTGTGYPLTMVTYAVVNMSKATAAQRTTIADMLRQVTTTGQVPGTALGQLPAGYLPLTQPLIDQAARSITEIRAYPARPATTVPTTSSSGTGAFGTVADPGAPVETTAETSADAQTPAEFDPLTAERTSAASPGAVPQAFLALALLLGIVGFIASPWLLRRRGAA